MNQLPWSGVNYSASFSAWWTAFLNRTQNKSHGIRPKGVQTGADDCKLSAHETTNKWDSQATFVKLMLSHIQGAVCKPYWVRARLCKGVSVGTVVLVNIRQWTHRKFMKHDDGIVLSKPHWSSLEQWYKLVDFQNLHRSFISQGLRMTWLGCKHAPLRLST